MRGAFFKSVLLGGLVFVGLGQTSVVSAQEVTATEANAEVELDLELYPVGGPTLEQAVYELLILDPAAADGIEALLAVGNSQQKMAIGTAFGRAVADLSLTDPEAAEPILLMVSEVTDIDFLTSFAAGTGDTATAALGGNGGVRGFSLNSTAPGAPFAVNGSSGVSNAGAGEITGDASANGVSTYTFASISESSFTEDVSISPITP